MSNGRLHLNVLSEGNLRCCNHPKCWCAAPAAPSHASEERKFDVLVEETAPDTNCGHYSGSAVSELVEQAEQRGFIAGQKSGLEQAGEHYGIWVENPDYPKNSIVKGWAQCVCGEAKASGTEKYKYIWQCHLLSLAPTQLSKHGEVPCEFGTCSICDSRRKAQPQVVAEAAPKTRNSEVLADFVAYCKANPELRFWQALRNWSGIPLILASLNLPQTGMEDTFYWKGKTK